MASAVSALAELLEELQLALPRGLVPLSLARAADPAITLTQQDLA